MKRKLASFWTGAPLGPIEQISALSFLSVGHELTVYSTGPVEGLPLGVELRDANEILSTQHIVTHRKTGSAALYSDLFRYALLNQTDYTWVDLDMVALRPLPDNMDYLVGFESAEEVNGAVLRLPAGSSTLALLSKFKVDTHGYPPFLTGFRYFRYVVKSLGRGLHISDWPWGSIGPRALTYYLQQTGEITHALPKEAFYPVSYRQVERFAKPYDLTMDSFGEQTYAVHLWGKALRQHIKEKCGGAIPENSFLACSIKHYSEAMEFDICSGQRKIIDRGICYQS